MKFCFVFSFLIGLCAGSSCWAGGSHSGGGQGVYDLKTRKVYFIDLLTPAEFQRLQPSILPLEQILQQFPLCTRVLSRDLRKTKYDKALLEAELKFDELVLQVPELRDVFALDFRKVYFQVTALKIPQLRDATNAPSQVQVQAGYYQWGVSLLQEQVLALMPPEHIQGLLIKETLRVVKNKISYMHANGLEYELDLSNAEMEQATRLVYKRDWQQLRGTSFFSKLSLTEVVRNVRANTNNGPDYSAPNMTSLTKAGDLPYVYGLSDPIYSDARSGTVFHASILHGFDVNTGVEVMSPFCSP